MLALLASNERGAPVVEGQYELTAEGLWGQVSDRLQGALNTTTYKTWFANAGGMELADDRFVIGVPNAFTREWIEGHYLGLISASVRDVTGGDRRVALIVADHGPDVEVLAEPQRTNGGASEKPAVTGMNPKYTFDSFVIGSSNRFAHAAALAVA